MKPHLSMITLGVDDITRSVRFYEQALGLPRLQLDSDEVAFFPLAGAWLGLFGREHLASDAGVPAGRSGFSGVSLAHNVSSRDEVDATLAQAGAAGATIVMPARNTSWGGYAGCFTDPDGHLWEVAWNPHLQVGPAV
jgi:uncharacterized protein